MGLMAKVKRLVYWGGSLNRWIGSLDGILGRLLDDPGLLPFQYLNIEIL
ncbi:hypothetical protein LMZ02_03215 [Paenibacillus macerans]|nr:hypothetical protein [Paenibacillus macerans]UMV48427.1 hypothetical protein LMZ02_03215 [Paenibacillus macerans]